jgi:hypothetical protein
MLKDAERNGITNQVIRYITPDRNSVAQEIRDVLDDLGVIIDESPLLR